VTASEGEKELETRWQIANLMVCLLPTSSGGFQLRTGLSTKAGKIGQLLGFRVDAAQVLSLEILQVVEKEYLYKRSRSLVLIGRREASLLTFLLLVSHGANMVSFHRSNAPQIFQSLLNDALRKYRNDWCDLCLENILLHSHTPEEHLENIEQGFKKLRRHKLYERLSNYIFKLRIGFPGSGRLR
jgi:hypothetical protein